MKLSNLIYSGGQWLSDSGPLHDVVVSSRVRLARNLAGMPFFPKCSQEQRAEIQERLRNEILSANIVPEMFYVDLSEASDLHRRFLVERHLISRQHAQGTYPHGVALGPKENVAIMVNEEDHLRVQVLRSGLQLEDAVQEAMRVDNLLEEHIDFAFHSRYGYLTACPTNVGTGLRVSVMLHLPALKMSGEIEKVFRAARDMHLAIRGLFGEGTEATGDFFQISNQTTLGRSEEEIVEEFCSCMLPNIIDYERRAREAILSDKRVFIEDKVGRALAVLKAARLISSEETMYLLSVVRLAVHLNLAEGVTLETVNELFLRTQPAHLQMMLERNLPSEERDQARADYIRKRLQGE